MILVHREVFKGFRFRLNNVFGDDWEVKGLSVRIFTLCMVALTDQTELSAAQ